MMLAQVLETRGCLVQAVSVTSLAGEMVDLVEQRNADVVCISATPPAAVMHARYLCKQLRRRFPKVKLVVGLWDAQGDLNKAKRAHRLWRNSCGDVGGRARTDPPADPAALAADRAAGAAGGRSNGHAEGASVKLPVTCRCSIRSPTSATDQLSSTLGILFQTNLRLRSNDYDSQTRY